jgi:hypothetical protein
MLNIIKAAVAAVVVAGSVSLAPVQALAAHHRHHPAPVYRGEYGPRYPQFESRDVYLPSPLTVPGPAEEQWFDRATQSFGGGI